MENIIQVGTKHQGVKVWLDEIGKQETHIYVAIAVSSKDDETAKAAAERVKNQEMLVLRKMGYELVGEAEVFQKEIEGVAYTVHKYVFQWTEWKKKVMGNK